MTRTKKRIRRKSKEPIWPRVGDLPENERLPFSLWLNGQTRPVGDTSVPQDQGDWYYSWDYERWKAGLPVID